MKSKRTFTDYAADSAEHGENNERDFGSHTPKKFKKSAANGVRPDNINSLKKRTRTIERRLNSGHKLPADVQISLERELVYHQEKIAELADEKKRKAMIAKYHMVRFFERKKADRLAKKVEKLLNKTTDPTTIEELKTDLHKAKIDGLYARYFPFRERYVSLYPVQSLGLSVLGGVKKEDASTAAQALSTDRPPMWKVIEEASGKGTEALVEIQERKRVTDENNKPEQSPKDAASSKTQSKKAKGSDKPDSKSAQKGKGRAKQNDDAGDDSDGGFFE